MERTPITNSERKVNVFKAIRQSKSVESKAFLLKAKQSGETEPRIVGKSSLDTDSHDLE